MNILTKKIIKKLISKNLTISICESCTGGVLSSCLTKYPNASKTFSLGITTYSNKSKNKFLKVPKYILDKHGSVSSQVCLSMLKNLNKIAKTDISISITGIAGPGGGTKEKPIGLVYLGVKKNNRILVKKYLFKNKGRQNIQKAAVNKSLKLIFDLVK